MQVIGHKTYRTYRYRYVGTKALYKVCNSDLFVKFGQFPCSWIRIRLHIANTDLEP
jgi:hypothetical protein